MLYTVLWTVPLNPYPGNGIFPTFTRNARGVKLPPQTFPHKLRTIQPILMQFSPQNPDISFPQVAVEPEAFLLPVVK